MISLNPQLFKNIAHIGSFKNVVFVFVLVFVTVFVFVFAFVFVLKLTVEPGAGPSQPMYISTGYIICFTLPNFSWNFSVFVFVFVFVCVFVIVIVIPGGLWIASVISFQKIYGLIG